MAGNNLDYNRLMYLNLQINNNVATKAEKDEYMLILYKNGNITQEQYDKYLSGSAITEDIVRAGIIIGGIILVGYFLDRLFSK